MKQYDKQKETDLLRKLFVLTAKRSMRPAMSDNMAMRLIFEANCGISLRSITTILKSILVSLMVIALTMKPLKW